MDDHTLSRGGEVEATSVSLKAPLAYSANTSKQKVFYRSKVEEDEVSSRLSVTMLPGNELPPPSASRGRRIRRRQRGKRSRKGGVSLAADAVAAKCWHVPVSIMGRKSRFLFDSGADITIVPYEQYMSLPVCERPNLTPFPIKVRGASGHPLEVRGTCRLPMLIADQEVLVDCTVVGGGCPALLGMNFIQEFDVQADFGRGQLRIGRSTVCCTRRVPPKGYPVELATDVEVPPQHEAVVHVKAVCTTPAKMRRQEFTGVISALNSFARDTGLVVGRTLVRSGSASMPVLMVNPNDYPVRVGRGSIVGNLSPIDCVLGSGVPEKEDIASGASSAEVGVSESSEMESTDDGSSAESEFSESDSEDQTAVNFVQCCPVDGILSKEGTRPLVGELEQLVSKLDLDVAQRQQVRVLLSQYSDVFALPGSTLGRTSKVQHRIETGRSMSIRQKARRIPAAQLPLYEEEMRKMRDLNIIEPSESPWASPTVLVRKKDGSMRFCVDY